MKAWETYRHCRSSAEPDEVRGDLQQLNRFAHAVTAQNQPSVLVPAAFRSRLDALPSRLAVDPRAMAAACALHGGQVAFSAGQPELSVELFTANVSLRGSNSNCPGRFIFAQAVRAHSLFCNRSDWEGL